MINPNSSMERVHDTFDLQDEFAVLLDQSRVFSAIQQDRCSRLQISQI
jgi:hypothetical protein